MQGLELRGAAYSLIFAVLVAGGAVTAYLLFRVYRQSHRRARSQRALAGARTNIIPGPKLLAVLVLAFAVHLINFTVVYL